MLKRGIMVGKEPLVRWHADDHAAAWLQDASYLGQSSGIVLDVLQDIRGDHYVEAVWSKWELNTISSAVRSSSTALCSANRKFIRLDPYAPAEGAVCWCVSPGAASIVENRK